MRKVYNFCAGPATLPLPVLHKIQEEFLDYKGSGTSIIEQSHRGELFTEIMFCTKSLLRELMNIPEDYEILLMHGGASAQFSTIPMNFKNAYSRAGYVDTGVWSSKAIEEAQKIIAVDVIASSQSDQYKFYPRLKFDISSNDYDYVHLTTNNTIYGTQIIELPTWNEHVPLVADMSSDILSKDYDVTQFSCIYAGAQKNLGCAGLAIVILKKDLLERSQSSLPSIFNYKNLSVQKSLANTPPTFSIYVCSLVLEWLKNIGGVNAIQVVNRQKADILYKAIDRSEIFNNNIENASRSQMNIPFSSGNVVVDQQFLQFAEKEGLVQLAGHRLAGGIRASIYNAMPLEGVTMLAELIDHFKPKA